MRSSALAKGCLLGAVLVVGSCGNAPQRSAERFCGELTAHAIEIRTAPESVDDIAAFITLLSRMGEVAPLDVQRDWEQVYGSVKTANTVNVDDPASLQVVADAAYKTQRSAENVAEWAKANCGLDIGPVGAVAGGAPVMTTTTEVEPSGG